MTTNNVERAFAAFGKLVAVATGVVGIAVGVFQLFPQGPDLRAVVFATDYAAPSYYFEAFREAREALYPYKLRTWFDEKSVEIEDTTLSEFHQHFKVNLIDERDLWREPYLALWKVTIQNRGDEPAESVVLDTPLVGWARTDLGAGRISDADIQGSVELGDLRPGSNIEVWIWARGVPRLRSGETIGLSYADGVGSVEYAITTWGWSSFYAQNHQMLVGIVAALVAAVPLLWLLSKKSVLRALRSRIAAALAPAPDQQLVAQSGPAEPLDPADSAGAAKAPTGTAADP